jgi:tripartite-type tricarboxylate transporter receptor subunit TctC
MRSSQRSVCPLTAALVAVLALSAPAAADPVADFYTGKQIKFIIRSGVGGSYDSYSRLLGRHIGRHIPGNPSVVPINMPGGGGIRSANYVAKVAPQDGTILTIVSQGLVVDQALGLNPTFQADLRDFNWVGNISASNQVLVTWHTSPTKTLADLMRRETVIGSSQAGSISVQMPAVLNNIVGTKIRIVFGYPDGKDINLAMERGEVEGRATNPWASYVSTDPVYVENKWIIPVIQMGMEKDASLPDVPLMRDLARNPADQPVLDFMSKAVSFGRPIATTPGVPAERVAALRRAFDLALKDPAFIQEAKTQRAEIQPMTGAELEQVVRDIIGAPADLRERVKLAIQPANAKEIPGRPAAE